MLTGSEVWENSTFCANADPHRLRRQSSNIQRMIFWWMVREAAPLRVTQASRLLVVASRHDALPCTPLRAATSNLYPGAFESSFRRDAETNRRDACATRSCGFRRQTPSGDRRDAAT